MAFKGITRTVWMLSLVSLFTDMASEMLYPVMPMYLKSIGFSVFIIGLLEGVAEVVAGLSKGYFGYRSDSIGRRLPFVQLGYTLSAISKPLTALFIQPVWVFTTRTLDRLGKGIRTGARDAMLSDAATPKTKGRVFGFHRAMDTLGAAIGPSLALLFLWLYPGSYKTLFIIAFVPGILAVLCTFLLKETAKQPAATPGQPFALKPALSYVFRAPKAYRKLIAGLLFFALFNSSDVFLLLSLKHYGLNDTETVACYIGYNLVYAALAYPLGKLADKLGLKNIFVFGLIVFALAYCGMASVHSQFALVLWMPVYGLYAAATEGISKAWISNTVPGNETATAIGSYSGLQSIAAMMASTVAGLLWLCCGPAVTLVCTGLAALIAAGYLYTLKHP